MYSFVSFYRLLVDLLIFGVFHLYATTYFYHVFLLGTLDVSLSTHSLLEHSLTCWFHSGTFFFFDIIELNGRPGSLPVKSLAVIFYEPYFKKYSTSALSKSG